MSSSKETTTIEDIIISILMHGGDRAALVVQATETTPMMVCVLMLSEVALARVGGAILPLLKKLGSGDLDEEMSPETPIGDVVAIASRASTDWCYFSGPYGKIEVMGAIVRGRALCEQIAPICTANGAPCSLDPQKPAAGYEITERVER